ncbi:MAG: hypothetical protein GF309_13835 [Candidatus Lokiarchaeota archaeon]|nr:hypothetical protein [Candidatus Lokiarchaeota archaeon]
MISRRRTIAFVLAFLVFVNLVGTASLVEQGGVEVTTSPSSGFEVSATDLLVLNETWTDLDFDDDDLVFHVYNHSTAYPIADANVSLYNTTDMTLYQSKATGGLGEARFEDIPVGNYTWNVTLENAQGDYDPTAYQTGVFHSDGPEAITNVEIGNLDWDNDDDDLNATILAKNGDPAEGLNFTVYDRDASTVYNETTVDADGVVYLEDIPEGNYTWYLTVASGDYDGYVLNQENFTADGTTIMVEQHVGPVAGDPDYYDLDIFIGYENTLDPIAGALVNVTYKNGTVIDTRVTGTNGTLVFKDLPVAFINWTVTLSGEHLGLSPYSYNLTQVSADIRSPNLVSPGNQEFLVGTPNMTLTWQLEDEYPLNISLYVDGSLEDNETWNSSSYEYTFNMTGYELGMYDVTIEALDQNQNLASDSISVLVYENVTPVVEGPDETIEFYYTQTGYSITWNVTDEHMDSYRILRNGTVVKSGTLNPDQPRVTVSLDGLGIGLYEYSLIANDTSGNTGMDNVTVKVKRDDIVPLVVYAPPEIHYFRGRQNLVRNWTVTDEFKSNYSIKVDGFIAESGAWDSETIEFDFGGLSDGVHWVVLIVEDLGGNTVQSSVKVVVSPPLVETYLLGAGVIGGIVLVAAVIVWYVRYR